MVLEAPKDSNSGHSEGSLIPRIKQYFPYMGLCQRFFPIGPEGFIIQGPLSVRGLPEQEVLDFMAFCEKEGKVPTVLENQLIPLVIDDFDFREVIRDTIEIEGEEKQEDEDGSS